MPDSWVSDPNMFGALYGSIVGGVGGSLGGMLGAAAGTLAPRGKGRGFILGAMWGFIILGVLQLGFGIAALVARQPYGVWYPPLLCGVIFTVVIGCLIPVVKKRYDEAERRKLEAEGIRGTS